MGLVTVAFLGLVLGADPEGGSGRPPIDFDTEIVPVLTKAGCNAGACHGSAAGRGGFKLSLWGGDASADYEAIVLQSEGRRVNLARPDESLVLAKPTGVLDHGGDVRLEADGEGASLVLEWIASGAERLQSRRLDHFAVEPASSVVARVGESVSLSAMASFDDGTRREVTAYTVFTPTDPAAVELDDSGGLTARRRGQHVVIARFLGRVVPVEITVPLLDDTVDHSGRPSQGFIDDEIHTTLATLRLPVAPRADDPTFLRRARLDLTGTLPTPDEIREFLADPTPDKRARLVDRLLATDEAIDLWTYRWATWLQIQSGSMQSEGAGAFHAWLREQIAADTPWDKVASTMLTADGDSFVVGPANFTRASSGPREQAEYVGRVLMGVRIGCANCHNHPLDRWTQDDYHGLAAVFCRLDRGREVRVLDRGEVTHPRTGEPAPPRLPGERNLLEDSSADPRAELASWITSRDNPYFAKSVVNRLWKSLMGRGLVEPVDDLRQTNPATHPELLDRLADDFRSHGYSLRRTLRLIATSEAYGRAAEYPDPADSLPPDDRFYSRAIRRPLEPEVLADAIAEVTGVSDAYAGHPPGTRAIQLADSKIAAEYLDLLGRCSRDAPCETGSSAGTGLDVTLHLINGGLINDKLESPNGRLARLLAGGASAAEILDDLYLRSLSREPTSAERNHWLARLEATDAVREEAWQDLVWGLLNCREFVTNH